MTDTTTTDQTTDDPQPISSAPVPRNVDVAGLPIPGIERVLPEGVVLLEPFIIPHGPGPIMLGVDPSTGQPTIELRDGHVPHWYLVEDDQVESRAQGDTWLCPEWLRGRAAFVLLWPKQ